jgi:hypothetical protein
MPSLEESIRIGPAKYFTKIDLSSAFWQIPILGEHRERTAFHYMGTTYVWKCMPFGLKCAPATFQRAMGKIFKDVINIFVKVYIDDILIYSNTLNI